MSTASDNLVAGLAALAEAIRTMAVDPADQVRLLIALADYFPVYTPSAAPIGGVVAKSATATAALCRRVALISLARACATYQPSSYDDAVALRSRVTALLDAEILVAADGGDDQTYTAFRGLRAAVIQNLTERAASLPTLITVTTPIPVPSLVLAYRLYGDAGRADDLTARANPIHPAFLPTQFKALSE